jgi:ribose transport system substrate-binding protein
VVQTNNVQAGTIACEYLVQKIGGKGNVIIQNGPQVSAVVDRVNGCKEVLAKHPDIKLLDSSQDAKGSREGGMNVMQGHLTRYTDLAGVFAINDPQAIGSDLAAKQLGRQNIVITSVDGAPDIEGALKGNTMVQASSSQDPYAMAQLAVQIGYDIINGKKPAEPMVLMESKPDHARQRGRLQGLVHAALRRTRARGRKAPGRLPGCPGVALLRPPLNISCRSWR